MLNFTEDSQQSTNFPTVARELTNEHFNTTQQNDALQDTHLSLYTHQKRCNKPPKSMVTRDQQYGKMLKIMRVLELVLPSPKDQLFS